MKKKVNHLGSLLEQQQFYCLPHQQKIQELCHLTDLVRQSLSIVLTEEVVNSLMVVRHEQQILSISTHSHTIANHLNYTRQTLLQILHQHCPSLQAVRDLKFRAVTNNTASSAHHLQSNQSVNSVTSCELSESTRQNIAQLAELVTDDEELSKVLRELASSK